MGRPAPAAPGPRGPGSLLIIQHFPSTYWASTWSKPTSSQPSLGLCWWATKVEETAQWEGIEWSLMGSHKQAFSWPCHTPASRPWPGLSMVLHPISGAESNSPTEWLCPAPGRRGASVSAQSLPPPSPACISEDFFVSTFLFFVSEKLVGKQGMRSASFYIRFNPVYGGWGLDFSIVPRLLILGFPSLRRKKLSLHSPQT